MKKQQNEAVRADSKPNASKRTSRASNASKSTQKTKTGARAKQRQQTMNAPLDSLTLGEYAHQIIQQQFDHLVKQEKHVLLDKDPEYLHQMRVGSRRLYTALQVFGAAIELPKAAGARRVRQLTRVLGKLRDLDVQMAALTDDYHPQLDPAEQESLEKTLDTLAHQRQKALTATRDILNQSRYQALKATYIDWLKSPRLTPLAQLPIAAILPDLLSPLLSHSLLHPAWLLSIHDLSDENVDVLHDLRKACKHARYQADFFVPFYGDRFKSWISDLKMLQDRLGQLQDIQVLRELLVDTLPKGVKMQRLHQIIDANQTEALSTWEEVRQRYLSIDFRYQLHQMLLEPQ